MSMNEKAEKKIFTIMSQLFGTDYSEMDENVPVAYLFDEIDLFRLFMTLREECGINISYDNSDSIDFFHSRFDKIISDGSQGKLRGKSDEEIINMFKSDPQAEYNSTDNFTLGQLLELIYAYIP